MTVRKREHWRGRREVDWVLGVGKNGARRGSTSILQCPGCSDNIEQGVRVRGGVSTGACGQCAPKTESRRGRRLVNVNRPAMAESRLVWSWLVESAPAPKDGRDRPDVGAPPA